MPDEGDDETRRDTEARIKTAMARHDFDASSPLGRALTRRIGQTVSGELHMLVDSGHVFERAARLGAPLERPAPSSWPDAANGLIYEATRTAPSRFVEKRLCRWDPWGPASLRTFATNYVLMSDFRSLYREYWNNERDRPEETTLSGPDGDLDWPAPDGAECALMAGLACDEAIRCVENRCWNPRRPSADDMRRVLDTLREDKTIAQVSRDLGIAAARISRWLSAFRRHLITVHGWSEGGAAP